MYPSSFISSTSRIEFGKKTSPSSGPNKYIHCENGIIVGDNVQIGPSVAIISANHDLENFDKQIYSPLYFKTKYKLEMKNSFSVGVYLHVVAVFFAGVTGLIFAAFYNLIFSFFCYYIFRAIFESAIFNNILSITQKVPNGFSQPLSFNHFGPYFIIV